MGFRGRGRDTEGSFDLKIASVDKEGAQGLTENGPQSQAVERGDHG